MAINDFKWFAIGGGANVEPQASYIANPMLSAGQPAGQPAPSPTANKSWRQGTMASALIGAFINSVTGADCLDDGNLATILTNFQSAITTLAGHFGMAGTRRNLKVTAAGGTTQATVTADAIVLATPSDGSPFLAEAVNGTVDISTVGLDGLDTGARVANTFYHLFVISDGTHVHTLASASPTSPTMPGGYTYKARVGAFLTDISSNIKKYVQYDRRVQLAAPMLICNGVQGSWSETAPGWASFSLTPFVPSTASSVMLMGQTNYGSHPTSHGIVAPNTNYLGRQSTTYPAFSAQGNQTESDRLIDMLIEDGNVHCASDSAGWGLWALGWNDNL